MGVATAALPAHSRSAPQVSLKQCGDRSPPCRSCTDRRHSAISDENEDNDPGTGRSGTDKDRAKFASDPSIACQSMDGHFSGAGGGYVADAVCIAFCPKYGPDTCALPAETADGTGPRFALQQSAHAGSRGASLRLQYRCRVCPGFPPAARRFARTISRHHQTKGCGTRCKLTRLPGGTNGMNNWRIDLYAMIAG